MVLLGQIPGSGISSSTFQPTQSLPTCAVRFLSQRIVPVVSPPAVNESACPVPTFRQCGERSTQSPASAISLGHRIKCGQLSPRAQHSFPDPWHGLEPEGSALSPSSFTSSLCVLRQELTFLSLGFLIWNIVGLFLIIVLPPPLLHPACAIRFL